MNDFYLQNNKITPWLDEILYKENVSIGPSLWLNVEKQVNCSKKWEHIEKIK